MSKKNKLKRYAQALTMPNIKTVSISDYQLQIPDSVFDKNFFPEPDREIILEIGCGRGDYSIALGKQYPEKNIIGVDIKSDRLLYGAATALEEGLSNVLFIRLGIECMGNYFRENTISEAWIPFPDPYAGKINGKKRLTSSRYITIYKKIMKPEAILHLKTDNRQMYEFSIASVQANNGTIVKKTDNLYQSVSCQDELLTGIQTRFEQKYLAADKTIKYLCFRL